MASLQKGSVPVAVVDLTFVFEASAPARAAGAFAIVFLLGGLLVRRREPFLDRSVDATLARPLASVGYGIAAHLVIGFASVYLTARLGGIEISGWDAGSVGVLALGLAVISAGVLGFTVVGTTIAEFWGGGNEWAGPFGGALIAALIAGGIVVDPTFGGVVWVLVVSMGIGGPVRRWLHASAIDV